MAADSPFPCIALACLPLVAKKMGQISVPSHSVPYVMHHHCRCANVMKDLIPAQASSQCCDSKSADVSAQCNCTVPFVWDRVPSTTSHLKATYMFATLPYAPPLSVWCGGHFCHFSPLCQSEQKNLKT